MNNKRVLNISEASELLGFEVSYIYKLTSAKILPHSKPNGKTIFFDKEKLEDWMLSNPSSTLSDKKIIASNYVATNSVINRRKKKNN